MTDDQEAGRHRRQLGSPCIQDVACHPAFFISLLAVRLCGHEHEWATRWATLVEERDPALADALPPLGIGGAPHALFTSVQFVDL
jgi:hypothetical protein